MSAPLADTPVFSPSAGPSMPAFPVPPSEESTTDTPSVCHALLDEGDERGLTLGSQASRRIRKPRVPIDPKKAFILKLPDELLREIIHEFGPWVHDKRTRKALVWLASSCRRLRSLVHEVMYRRCEVGIDGTAKASRRIRRLEKWLSLMEGQPVFEEQPHVSAFVKELSLQMCPLDEQALGRLPTALQRCTNLTSLSFSWPRDLSGVDLLNALPPTLEQLVISSIDPLSGVDGDLLAMKARPSSVKLLFYRFLDPALMAPTAPWSASPSPEYGPPPPPSRYLERLLRHVAQSGRLRTLRLSSIPSTVSTDVLVDVLASAAGSLSFLRLQFPRYRHSPPARLGPSAVSCLHRLETLQLINFEVDISALSLLALPATLKSLAFRDCFGTFVPSVFQAYLSAPRSGSLEYLRLILRERVGTAWDDVKEQLARRRAQYHIFPNPSAVTGNVKEQLEALDGVRNLVDW